MESPVPTRVLHAHLHIHEPNASDLEFTDYFELLYSLTGDKYVSRIVHVCSTYTAFANVMWGQAGKL